MAQLKVQTFTRGKPTKSDLILRCLGGYPEGLTPKAISLKTGLNANTVKSLLPKIANIRRVTRGWYKVVNRGDGTLSSGGDLLSWNFHNLVLTAPCESLGAAPASSFVFGLVRCDLSVVRGRATFRVSSDYPLNVSSICFVAGFFAEVAAVVYKDVMVSTIEFNKDYRNLRLDGVRCISVDGLVEQFKVYQKRLGMRLEHKTKVPMSVETLVDMLSSQPDTLDLKYDLSLQKQAIARLTAVLEANTQMIFKLAGGKG